ncbi:MAG: dnaG 2 [Propionibacteriaceae bacterium]|nr:dnaG 2 [Propionibacteriaceae bacterium]
MAIIDEAGMADTLTLGPAVQLIVQRGGGVRLVGDDQQLAAIRAGGVLRDIQASHGAVRLSELHRFTDAAEAPRPLHSATADPKQSACTWTGTRPLWQRDRSLAWTPLWSRSPQPTG